MLRYGRAFFGVLFFLTCNYVHSETAVEVVQRTLEKKNFTCKSWSILMYSLFSDIRSSFAICLHNTMRSSYFIKVSPSLLKTLIVSFAIISACSSSWKIRFLGDLLDHEIFRWAWLWILLWTHSVQVLQSLSVESCLL